MTDTTVLGMLRMSDDDFMTSYFVNNIRWWKNRSGLYQGEKVYCSAPHCKQELNPETARVFGGKHYCDAHHAQEVLDYLYNNDCFGREPPEIKDQPTRVEGTEWILRVVRVLDGNLSGLARLARELDEYAEDEEYLAVLKGKLQQN